jgi:hypothetical protein
MKLTKSGYINYENKVLIIQNSGFGTPYKIQWGGVECKQFEGKGILLKEFETNNKYFNSEYWYSLYCWFLEENLLYFAKDHPVPKYDIFKFSSEKYNQLAKVMKPKAVDAKKVLDDILNNIKKITKKNIFPNFEDFRYGRKWGEAFIPVKFNNKKSILTWQNCD